MSPNDADGIANSVDPDRTAGCSGSALFAQAYLSKNLGSLRYNGENVVSTASSFLTELSSYFHITQDKHKVIKEFEIQPTWTVLFSYLPLSAEKTPTYLTLPSSSFTSSFNHIFMKLAICSTCYTFEFRTNGHIFVLLLILEG